MLGVERKAVPADPTSTTSAAEVDAGGGTMGGRATKRTNDQRVAEAIEGGGDPVLLVWGSAAMLHDMRHTTRDTRGTQLSL